MFQNPQRCHRVRISRIILIATILVTCCLTFIFPTGSYSKDAQITDILVTSDASHLTVFAKVMNCFTKKMESAILAGVPTTFTFLLELYQERENWFDKNIAGKVVKQTVKYDSVKKIFYVSSTETQQQSGFQDIESAKKSMAELNGAVIVSIAELQKDKTYYIKIKAKLDKVRLPMHMEYVFFFVSLWDFETDWYRQTLEHISW